MLAKAAERHAPKAAKGGAPVKILFATQIGVAPPTFVLSLNHPVDLHFSYKRYLENQLREEFGFEGTPHRPEGPRTGRTDAARSRAFFLTSPGRTHIMLRNFQRK